MRVLPPALAPLGAHAQFIHVKLVPDPERPGKTIKLPIDWRTGRAWDAHDPAIWMTGTQALALLPAWGPEYCLGWTMTRAAGVWCVDVDDCITPAGQWSETATKLMALLHGAAIELSQSRKGLHLWGSGPVPEHGCKCEPLHIELYSDKRFIALTGEMLGGDARTDHTSAIASLVVSCFPPDPIVEAADWTDGPCAEWNGPTDDDDLIRRAMASSSAASTFGNRASFADLWTANAEALGRAYPDSGGRGHNASSADAALAQHLAFWTGKDATRIERLMLRSALVRNKWDREDYLGPRTILGAISRQVQVLQDKRPEPVALALVAPAEYNVPRQHAVEGDTFLGPQQQVAMFSGCVYVSSVHKILIPGGRMLKPAVFKTKFGGYTFAMDKENRRTSRDAFEAFTESQTLRAPQADNVTFRPDLPPVALVKDDGRQLGADENYPGQIAVNVWWPPVINRVAGDVTLFLDHMGKLLPNERDRMQLLYYMAAVAQNPGVKFKWMPLIQGVEGNGKTLLSIATAKAVGERYAYWPAPGKMGKDFNAWFEGTVLVCIEDVYKSKTDLDILEKLKPMIAGGAAFEIEGKGVDQRNARVCANLMANTNHKNGIPKSANDRRIAPFYCAQQHLSDLARDGMGAAYFTRLYRWLEREDGYEKVADYLLTLPIPDESNPALGGRAPITSSTAEAIHQGMGSVEQEVLEAVDQDVPGFAGGWVSSMAFDRLLERMGRESAVGRNRRPDLLRSLGYVAHPGLADGRVCNSVLPDGGRPRLYVRQSSPLAAIVGASEIARAYSASQLAR